MVLVVPRAKETDGRGREEVTTLVTTLSGGSGGREEVTTLVTTLSGGVEGVEGVSVGGLFWFSFGFRSSFGKKKV